MTGHSRPAPRSGIWNSVAFVPPQPIRHALRVGSDHGDPSYAKSLPYVILEAAAAAQPLVATIGGIPEIFGPHAGDLIPARDVSRLAAAIEANARREPAGTPRQGGAPQRVRALPLLAQADGRRRP